MTSPTDSGDYRSQPQPPEVVLGAVLLLTGGLGLVLWLVLGLAEHWTVAIPAVLSVLGILLILG